MKKIEFQEAFAFFSIKALCKEASINFEKKMQHTMTSALFLENQATYCIGCSF
jgi:hypothetical protein